MDLPASRRWWRSFPNNSTAAGRCLMRLIRLQRWGTKTGSLDSKLLVRLSDQTVYFVLRCLLASCLYPRVCFRTRHTYITYLSYVWSGAASQSLGSSSDFAVDFVKFTSWPRLSPHAIIENSETGLLHAEKRFAHLSCIVELPKLDSSNIPPSTGILCRKFRHMGPSDRFSQGAPPTRCKLFTKDRWERLFKLTL